MKKNRLLKRISLVFLALILLFSFSACGSEPAQENAGEDVAGDSGYEEATIRYGSIWNEETVYGQTLEKVKADIEEASGGKIVVDLYHGGVLGSEQEHAQAVKDGSLEMMYSGTAGVGLFVPATTCFETWFSFEDVDQLAEAVVTLWDDLDSALAKEGFKLLGAYYDGPRQILSNVKVTNLDELKGLKLRAPGAQVYVNSVTALGAQAISMPLGDVYTSLQTGAIDAMEGTIDTIYGQKFYEQGKYIIEDAHVCVPMFIVYNLDAWNALPAKSQELIAQVSKDSMDYHMELYKKAVNEEIEILKASGVEFVAITDREKWVEAVYDASEEYVAKYGELGQKIREVVKSYQ